MYFLADKIFGILELKDFFTITASFLALLISIINSIKANNKQNYLEQDKAYQDLLKISLNHPTFRDPKEISRKIKEGDRDFIQKYNTYAYLIWNCMETFYDLSSGFLSHIFHKKHLVSETWVPVIREENRIHYNWFMQNQSLFKKKFQDYINDLNAVRVSEGKADDLETIHAFMKTEFPENELMSLEQLKKLFESGKYILYLLENVIANQEKKILGYALVYVLEPYRVAWLDYLAIDKENRKKGYGTLLFNNVNSNVGRGGFAMIMELDKPQENALETSVENKRIMFYKKQGAKELKFDYLFPTKTGPLEMLLYYKTATGEKLIKKELLKEVINEVMETIHSDKKTMPVIKKQVLDNLNKANW
ncbi:MAG: GNAT family N-acetyltransferase [Bacillales bacterium]|jgi:GNAT superfamily N-acetyltransferase|nr:GNAT family N-acetyltransferase [Bacillales bacterium]